MGHVVARVVLVLILLAGGCAARVAKPWPKAEPARQHVVAIDEEGWTIDPDRPGSWDERQAECEFDAQLDAMFAGARRWGERQPAGKPRKLLVFVHGGMNEPLDALDRSREHREKLLCAGYYPVFVVWNSGLKSSYVEHLGRIRQGRFRNDQAWGAPFFLLADVGRAVARAPIVWGRLFAHDFHRASGEVAALRAGRAEAMFAGNRQLRSTALATEALVADYEKHADRAIETSLGKIRGNESSVVEVMLFSGSPFWSSTVSWLLDSTGTAAWDNMYRRALMLFDGPAANEIENADEGNAHRLALYNGRGALEKLIDELARLSPRRVSDASTAPATTVPATTTATERWEITLVGHSMGAIVLNELLSRGGEVDVDRIVYMAAACTAREAHRAVLPYLDAHRGARFHNLTLHPANDIREVQKEYYGLPPRGSLLVWIDDMFANPATALDRTFGRWDNAVQTAYAIPPAVRGRVHFKAFDMYVDLDDPERPAAMSPQKHGDFSDCRYWDPDFWKPQVDPERALRPVMSEIRGAAR